MASILVVGATRGLGASLVRRYAKIGKSVFGTTRGAAPPKGFEAAGDAITWLVNVDLTKSSVGDDLVQRLGKTKVLEAVVCRPLGGPSRLLPRTFSP